MEQADYWWTNEACEANIKNGEKNLGTFAKHIAIELSYGWYHNFSDRTNSRSPNLKERQFERDSWARGGDDAPCIEAKSPGTFNGTWRSQDCAPTMERHVPLRE